MNAPQDIIIDDLAHPRLTPAIIAARQGPADFDENMTVEDILARAVEITGGLDDFGEDSGFMAVAAEDRDPNDPSTWGRIARNEPCPCGSGKKYKHCHGAFEQA